MTITHYFKKWAIAFFLFICFFRISIAQFTAPPNGTLFQDNVVPRIDIKIDQESIDFILNPQNAQSDELHVCTFIFSTSEISDTIENVGFRLRGNTSRGADKKSFKVDFNTFEGGRKYKGVEKMNLNGQHNDPTISRAKICSDLARWMGIPTMRSNHVELYINDEYYGLYINVEHIDEEYVDKRFGNNNGNLYKCLYPADLAYLGADPDQYKVSIFGRRKYDLKTNLDNDDYSDLAEFIDILNNTNLEDRACTLEKIFNVDTYLKFIVFDILTGNWDGPLYNQNNFYLYKNSSSGLFEYIPFDLDNTLGIDWLSRDWGTRNIYTWSQTNQTRPLFTEIMEIDMYKDRFSFYLKEAIDEFFNIEYMEPYLDNLRNIIFNSAENDVFASLDYGFGLDDFWNGFDKELDYFQTDYGIKPFVSTRASSAMGQLELNNVLPFIKYDYSGVPISGLDYKVEVEAVDDGVVEHAELCYSFDGGIETCESVSLIDSGFEFVIPIIEDGTQLSYRVILQDNSGQEGVYPLCGVIEKTIQRNDFGLVINEIVARNTNGEQDENGDSDDWVELYNMSEAEINLEQFYLSDNPFQLNKWRLPPIDIPGNGYVLIWADNEEVEGALHANFKLSGNGEELILSLEEEGQIHMIDHVTFPTLDEDVAWARSPNGKGVFVEKSPTPRSNNDSPLFNSNYIPIDKVLDVFPNPTINYLYIKECTLGEYRIYSSTGRLVQEGVFEGKVDISSLRNGHYTIVVNNKLAKLMVVKN